MEDWLFAVVVILAALTGSGVVISLTNAFTHRLRHGPGGSKTLAKELQETQRRLEETESVLRELSAATGERITDMEDRLDLTERILQQERQQDKLPG
jgi:hypothetical protein